MSSRIPATRDHATIGVASSARGGQSVASLRAVLGQVFDVVEALDDEQYARRPVGPFESSIGGQVRHCVDHFQALFPGVESGRVDYDKRERGTSVETNRAAALETLRHIDERLCDLEGAPLDQPIELTVMVLSDADPIKAPSSLGREMAFVLSHTIHHNAMIAAMAKIMDASIPDQFGYAPSTIAFLKQSQCAQ